VHSIVNHIFRTCESVGELFAEWQLVSAPLKVFVYVAERKEEVEDERKENKEKEEGEKR